jgi:AbrB family looped-hinge helix DNA binding protein
MAAVTLSKRFGFVIPNAIRESLRLAPGQELQVFVYDNRIQLVPVTPIAEKRGSLRGIDTTVDRDADRA